METRVDLSPSWRQDPGQGRGLGRGQWNTERAERARLASGKVGLDRERSKNQLMGGKKRQKGDQVKAEKLKKQNVTGHILGACRSIVRSGSARSVRLWP